VRKLVGIGVDVGATKVRVCVGEESGRLIWRKSTQMIIPPNVEGYVDELVSRVREAREQVPPGAEISGIGVASVGPLDLKRGGIASPANLPYKFVPVVDPLERAFGWRVALMNDANAAALGERMFGAGKDDADLVFITLSTGIGGGAIVDGNLLIGKDGNAAEIGHMVVDSQGRLTCGCGRKGHWEAYCSGRNIPSLAGLLEGESPVGRNEVYADSATILRAASEGDSFAGRVAVEMGRLNAIGVANVVDLYDPSLVTIGGGVALANGELVLKPIRDLVPEYAINRAPRIMITPLGDDAGLLGGLSLAFRS
jgi:glucokinase